MMHKERAASLDVIQNELESGEDLFETAAIAGSNRNDIDVFVVLREEHGPYEPPLSSILDTVQEIQDRLSHEHGVSLSVFPTFRMEIFDRVLSATSLGADATDSIEQLHLLVYPTFEHLKEWEDPMLVRTVAMSAEVVFGNEARFRALAEEVDIPPFERRVASKELFSLLIDNQIYLKGSKAPRDVVRRETAHKASYVVRYLTFNYLLDDYSVEELLTWEDIATKEIDQPTLDTALDTCYGWRQGDRLPNVEAIRTVNENLLELLDEWLNGGSQPGR